MHDVNSIGDVLFRQWIVVDARKLIRKNYESSCEKEVPGFVSNDQQIPVDLAYRTKGVRCGKYRHSKAV